MPPPTGTVKQFKRQRMQMSSLEMFEAVSPRCVAHTGGIPATQTTDGTDTTPSVSETYIAEVFIPCRSTVTGIAFLNGSAVAGNLTGILYNKDGVVVATTASTAASGTDAYQSIALSAAYTAEGPATYYVGLQCSSTSQRLNTHILGRFGASKKTGETYGTATNITPPTTFTTAQGPIASLY